MPEAPVVLHAQGVSRRFAKGVTALSPVDLTVHEGEFVTLLGPSGCGKTTLLRLMSGLDTPSTGTLTRAVDEDGLSYVFQDATLMPWASVRTNVRLPLDLQRGAGKRFTADAAQAVEAALERVGLSDFGDAFPRELSGGMRMRVSIARALVTEPKLLLMDEPFGALDDITRQHLDDELLTLARRHKLTVVFVTHNVFEAVYLSTRVVVMSARPGRIVDDVKNDVPVRDAAFRGSPDFALRAARLQAALLKGQQPGAVSAAGIGNVQT
ncbi:nitrate/sulfonate/bicarbonate ABC transporter ATP-binding protein [Pigmentiphaga litoralis]|uniref:ABC transporter ATP-binding protein n=1 Tax=Pigmentiphaga litoralis TaxID=516702 RepID=UPI0019BF2B02|nr:nitrate/sulfonate/bicarbonate ABC transporter ATP-binding protein [Pigmentiphaga litoralis]